MKKLPYLYREKTRHGKFVWYVKRGPTRIRIRETPGTKAFFDAYHAALAGKTAEAPPAASSASLAWLIGRYMESPAWAATAAETRKQHGRQYRIVVERSGSFPYAAVKRAFIAKGRDRRAAVPSDANKFVKAMRRLFEWAIEREYIESNPAAGVKLLPPKKKGGFHTWTESELTLFEECWPVGTRERLAFDILCYTGLRRSDVVRLGRAHVTGNEISIRTKKTDTLVTLPILPPLAASIDAAGQGGLTFLKTERGTPFKSESFGTWFGKACSEAGAPGSAHGIRKAAAVRAANMGASDTMLNAMFGWAQGSRESATYTREVNRAKLSRENAPVLFFRTPVEGAEEQGSKALNKKSK